MNILLILSIIIFCLGFYLFYFASKIKFDKQEQLQQKQKELQTKTIQLNSISKQIQFYTKSIVDYKNQLLDNQKQLTILHQEQQRLENQLKSKEEYLNKYYDSIKKESQQAFNNYQDILDESYRKQEQNFITKISKLKTEQESVQNKLDQLKNTYQIAVAAQLREKEEWNKWRFYTIHISKNQANDITKLQEWKKDLYDPSIVSKVIWSTYIIKPAGDLCNRVVGPGKVCGIYKITDKNTGKVYIGQSVDISNRFKTHIKCGLGIDTPPASANKLYKAMQNSSLQYWTFEVIEKCSSGKLNEREKYWIDFYQSDKLGLNSTKGNK